MASVNKVIIVGNLGKDPEVRYTPNGSAVCNLSVATSRNWKSRETGERQEETEWHRVVLYDRQAEVARDYLKKGRPVYIEGRIKTRKWQDKDGRDVYTTEIIGDTMQLLGGRDDNDDDGGAYRRDPVRHPNGNATGHAAGHNNGRGPSSGGAHGGSQYGSNGSNGSSAYRSGAAAASIAGAISPRATQRKSTDAEFEEALDIPF